jgi:hypothetical protein
MDHVPFGNFGHFLDPIGWRLVCLSGIRYVSYPSGKIQSQPTDSDIGAEEHTPADGGCIA